MYCRRRGGSNINTHIHHLSEKRGIVVHIRTKRIKQSINQAGSGISAAGGEEQEEAVAVTTTSAIPSTNRRKALRRTRATLLDSVGRLRSTAGLYSCFDSFKSLSNVRDIII